MSLLAAAAGKRQYGCVLPQLVLSENEYTFDRDADQVKRINTSYRHINAFEKQLTDDNYVLLKFFVHVSEKQLKANVQKAEKPMVKAGTRSAKATMIL